MIDFAERRRLLICLLIGLAITVALIHPGYHINGDRPIEITLMRFTDPGVWLALALYSLTWMPGMAWVLFIGGNSLFYGCVVWVVWISLIWLCKRRKKTAM